MDLHQHLERMYWMNNIVIALAIIIFVIIMIKIHERFDLTTNDNKEKTALIYLIISSLLAIVMIVTTAASGMYLIYIAMLTVYMNFSTYMDIKYRAIYTFPTLIMALISFVYVGYKVVLNEMLLSKEGIGPIVLHAIIITLVEIMVLEILKMGKGDAGLLIVFNSYLLNHLLYSGIEELKLEIMVIHWTIGMFALSFVIFALYSICIYFIKRKVIEKRKYLSPYAPAVYVLFCLINMSY